MKHNKIVKENNLKLHRQDVHNSIIQLNKDIRIIRDIKTINCVNSYYRFFYKVRRLSK